MEHPHFNNKIQRTPMQITKAMTDDRTTTTVILPLVPSFFLLVTSTPMGFTVIPSLPLPGYAGLSTVVVLDGIEGGEGGRPIKM